jgi:hypothetical protein
MSEIAGGLIAIAAVIAIVGLGTVFNKRVKDSPRQSEYKSNHTPHIYDADRGGYCKKTVKRRKLIKR